MWFNVKKNWQIYYAARHFFDFISRVKKPANQFPPALLTNLFDSLKRNFHNGHPESILTAACVDDDEATRRWAVETISWARENTTDGIRLVQAPNFNFEADRYIDLVQFDQSDECNPPILRTVELKDCIDDPDAVKKKLHFPCHSQANERYVQEVHKAVPLCKTDEDVMGVVRLRELSRQQQGVFKSKQDFKLI